MLSPLDQVSSSLILAMIAAAHVGRTRRVCPILADLGDGKLPGLPIGKRRHGAVRDLKCRVPIAIQLELLRRGYQQKQDGP